MKYFLFLLFSLSSLSAYDTVDRYVDFINQIGRGENVLQSNVEEIFEPDCSKIFNGNLVAKDSESIVADLLAIYRNYGSWQIHVHEVLDAIDAYVIRISIESQTLGFNTAIVILRTNIEDKITEINEVFSPVPNEYEFVRY